MYILKFPQENHTIHSSQALYYVTNSPYLNLSVEVKLPTGSIFDQILD